MKLGDAFPEEIKRLARTDKHVAELKPNDEIKLPFRVASKRLQYTKDNKPYLLITLADKTGEIRAIDWHNAVYNNSRLRVGGVIEVTGRVVVYDDRLQIVIDADRDAIKMMNLDEIDSSRFLERTEYDTTKLFEEVLRYKSKVRNHFLQRLLEEFLHDPKIKESFLEAPAGIKVHHAYVGGLLEHTVFVIRLVSKVCEIYHDLDRDLLITAAILHDIGKIESYEISPAGINHTDAGELVGHVVMGVQMLREKINKIKDFPDDLAMKLEHMLVSHHGEMEFGSPVIPKTKEALVLHMLDDLDSKLAQFRRIESSAQSESVWSDYDRYLGRRIYLGRDEE
ncbi:MAG: 3-5 exoribonuclease [Thermotogota bacterium]|nr:3-5 exoribonuclease [Thermotogota bacterium]HCZ05976.1 phosphohydrolase [Thermotogota bacterium]